MAASTFYLPFRPALDANALTVPGAGLYFYAEGTTTPQTVYAEEALATPLSNPVEANAAGKWPSIYLDDSLTYRVVLKDADGATLDDQDPYVPGFVNEGPRGEPGGNVMAIGPFSTASALTIPTGTDRLRTSKWGTSGGGADYIYDAAVDSAYVAAHPSSSFLSANGRGFKVDPEQRLLASMFGDLGTTDDAAVYSTALTYAGAKAVSGSVDSTVSALSLNNFSKIVGPVTLVAKAGTTNVLSTASGAQVALQTSDICRLADIRINGVTGKAGTVTCFKALSHAALVWERLRAFDAQVGFYFDRAQFGSAYSCKAYNCHIGLYIRPSPTEGGGNSWSYYDFQAIGCDGGVLINNAGNAYPNHSLQFYNPSILDCDVFNFAVIGASSTIRTQVTIYGAAPEDNAESTGPASLTFDGVTIPRCSYYFKYCTASLIAGYNAEDAATNPMTILEGSHLSLHDMVGYGAPNGIVVQADAQSSVSITGLYGLLGTCQGVVSFAGSIDAGTTGGCLQTLIPAKPTDRITNLASGPHIGGVTSHSATSRTTKSDARGAYSEVVFGTAAGDANNNAAYATVTMPVTGRLGYALALESNTDCELSFRVYPNNSPKRVILKAGVENRIAYWTADDIASGVVDLLFYKVGVTGSAVTVKVREGHIIGGDADDPEFQAQLNELAGGAYNPGSYSYALTDGATIDLNLAAGDTFNVTLGGNRTFANPTNDTPGKRFKIKVAQDATGSRVADYGSDWRFPAGKAVGGVLSTAANAIDEIDAVIGSDGLVYATLTKAFAA